MIFFYIGNNIDIFVVSVIFELFISAVCQDALQTHDTLYTFKASVMPFMAISRVTFTHLIYTTGQLSVNGPCSRVQQCQLGPSNQKCNVNH